jgi:dethiobiotin synthase
MMCFVTGTDTGVGKTIAAAVLTCYYTNQGKSVGIVKPIQTGFPPDNDCETIRKLTGLPKRNFLCPLTFRYPLAPRQAAELEKRPPIDVKELITRIKAFARNHDICLIEGAGGVYVPIKKKYYMLDLIKDLNCSVVVVSRTGLGTINHALLTIKALRRKQIALRGIIFNNTIAKPDISAKLNPYVVSEETGEAVLGIMPFLKSCTPQAIRRCGRYLTL